MERYVQKNMNFLNLKKKKKNLDYLNLYLISIYE